MRIVATLIVAFALCATFTAAGADAAMVDAGAGHNCAIARSGSVLCWGANASGQLGDGGTTPSAKPVVVPTFVPESSDVTAVVSGSAHSCALVLDGTVMCWGENGAGQLGDGSTTDSSSPVPAGGVSNAVKLAAGLDFTCALIADGSVKCWGEGSGGQLGNGAGADSLSPVTVSGSANASNIAAGDAHACVIGSGSVRCWGANASGQLGDGSTTPANAPVATGGVSGATRISAGASHSCAVTATDAKCWGANASGQLGDGTTVTPRTSPVTVTGLTSPSNVTSGDAHSCAIDATPAVKCWGAGASGQLGNGANGQSSTPVTVSSATSGSSLSASGSHTCLLDGGGVFRCWGGGSNGEIGDGGTSNRNTPSVVLSTAGGKLMTAGASHSCVALSGGKVNCWGANGSGQLGDTSLSTASTPVVAYNLFNLASIAAGTTHTCAVEVGGQAKCWGANGSGQLGIGAFTPTYSNYAGNVSGLTDAVAVDAGANHTCALTTGATVRCWGQAGNYQLGNGSTSNSNTTVSVTGLTNAIAVSAGGTTSCAIVSGGQAKCWGNNGSGQVGQGNTNTPVTAPANVSGVTTATMIANGANHSCAVLADTTVKCWGDNQYGQVGDGTTTTPRSTPQVVSGLSGVKAIAVGDFHTCAIVALGAVKCWGYGANGRLGNSGTSNSSLPADVTGMLGAVSLAAGGQHTCAAVNTGHTYCWGYGFNSQLGNGSTADRTAPFESEKVLEGLITITTPLEGAFTQSTQPSIDYITQDLVSPVVDCNLDYAGWSSCSFPPFTPGSPLSIGRHTMQIRAAPSFGGNDVISYTDLSFSVSVVLPTATISAPAEAAVLGDNTPSMTFGATGEGALTVECRADSGTWTACSSPWTSGTLTDGPHGLHLRVTDANTNVASASVNVTIDTTPPDTTITSNPPSPSNTSSPSFSFSSSEGSSTFQCRINSGGWNACSSPHVLSGLGNGSHTFDVRAIDTAANIDLTPASYTWTIDLTPPDTSITANPANPTMSTAAAFTFSATETATFQCQLDSSGYSACTSPRNYSSLADGPHTFYVRATDTAGNTDATPASFTWTVDTTPPDTSITANPANPTMSTAAAFSFSATETATFQCQLDSGGYSACTSPRNYSALTEGVHTFYVRATDTAGNTDSTPASFSWTIDLTPPDTSITANPAAISGSTSAAFSFSATETATFQCQLDSGGYSACTSPRNYSSLADGPHTFYVRATDAAGNTDGSSASFAWVVDTVAPDTSITANPPSLSTSSSAAFSFNATETSSFQCQIDGGTYGGCTSPQGYGSLADGPHTFAVHATDAAGNEDASPASFAWTIDTTPPGTSITANPANPTTSTSAAFNFSATETATFQCQLDSGGYSACTSPRNYSSLGAGSHTFMVRATDTAGNTDPTPASFNWTIDLTPPDTSIAANPPDPANLNSAAFSFSATETATFQCQLDSGGYSACTSPRNYSSLADGLHTFYVRATDTAGNTDPSSASYSWTIDTVAPNTTITANPPSISTSSSASFSFSASETATFSCRLDYGTWAGCTSSHNLSALADGSHTFDVRATDAAGNLDASPASYTWTVDAAVPETSITAGPQALSNSSSAALSFSANESATFQCQLDGGGYSACSSPRNYSSLADGPHTFMVRATDGAGNTDATPATHSWTIDTVAPNTSITANPPSLTSSNSAAFSFSATETASFQCSFDGGVYGACTSPQGYAALADGPHTFDVRATDAAGNTDATPAGYSWTVDATPPDTTIDTAPPALSTSNAPTFTFSAPGATGFDCRTDSGTWSACTSPHGLTALADGPHTFYVRATDAAGNTDASPASHAWTVDATSPNTSITANPASLTNSTSAAFSFSATETATFQCQLDSGGYSACTSPRNYSSLADGLHTFYVRATDTAGNTDPSSASYSWTIDSVAPNTSITANPSSLTNSTAADFSFSATETSTFQCQLDGGGYSACTSPRNYSSLADGPHTFSVRATDVAGNTDATPASFGWTIDTASPDTTITANPALLTVSTAAPFSFSATETATFQCRLDGGGYSACTSPRVYSALADGPHTFYVRATDSAGNTDPTSASYSWTVDATAPNVQITTPAEAATLGDTTPSATFTATDANGATAECQTDTAGWAACSSPYTAPSLADGSHSIQVRASDPAGNIGTATVNFTIDSTYPTALITTPTEGQATADTTPSLSFSVTGSAPLTTECSVDGGTFAACTSGGSLAALTDGPHTLTLRVTDSLLRVVTADRGFTVDAVDPVAGFTSPAAGAVLSSSPVNVVFGVTDATAVTATCSVDSGTAASCSSPFVTGALADGPHTVDVVLTDAAGNTGAASRDFVVDTTAPAVSIGTPADGATVSASTVSIAFSSTDANAVSHECSVDGGAYLACVSPYSPTLAAGAHNVSVRATDAAGTSAVDSVVFTFAPPAPPSDPPASTPTGPQTYKAVLTASKKGAKLKTTLKLTPPPGVTAACAGTVAFSGKLLRVKIKGSAVLKPSAGTCRAVKTIKVKRTLKGKLKLTARFPGSAQIAAVKLTKTFRVK